MNPNNPKSPPNRLSVSLGHIILLAGLLGSFILAFFPVWKRLIETWSSSADHSHGFFIIPICAYIVWQKRGMLKSTPINGSRWGLPLLVFFALVYAFAHFAEILTLTSLSMVMLLGSAVLYILGKEALKKLVFPLFILLFMIPVPGQIYSALSIHLQLAVSKASLWVVGLLDLPVYREGNVIHLPDRALEVVQACGGLRSMTNLLTLSVVFGYLTLRSNVLRSILFISGIPVAVFINVVRVTVLVVAFYYLKYDLTSGTPHTVFGIAIFVLAILLVAIIRGVLSHWERSSKAA